MKVVNKIPKVDLADFLSDDLSRKSKFVAEIGTAYEEIGFVALKGHFLGNDLIEKMYDQVRLFFNLDSETKDKYELKGLSGQRGYTSFGKEHAVDRKEGDLKEFWHLGQDLRPESKYFDVYPKNIYVEDLPEFKDIGQEIYRLLEKTGKYVLRALALYLDLEEHYFDPFIYEGNSILRSIHYPPITEEPGDAVRAAAHTDINLITLLMGAQGKGLEVRNHAGEWIEAIADEDELMINVGDMLSRHSNNRLVSTIHRVVNPPKDEWFSPRFSIPFFLHPVSDMRLDCLENCIDEDHPKLYEDISAGEFLQQRLIEIGLE